MNFPHINIYDSIKKAFGKLSNLAETLIGSEIVRLGADIKEKIKKGEKIYKKGEKIFHDEMV